MIIIKISIVADWPTGQSLFLMSHPDVSLVNILLSITRVSLVQNKCVFCQLRVHYSILYFIQIRHTDDFPSKGTRLVDNKLTN